MKQNLIRYLSDKFEIPYITAQFLLVDWDIVEYPHFTTMTQLNEVHVMLKGKFMPRDGFKDVFGPLIRQYGKVITRCQQGNSEHIYFIERIGFRRVGVINGFIQYEIEHIPFQNRRQPCPSLFQ